MERKDKVKGLITIVMYPSLKFPQKMLYNLSTMKPNSSFSTRFITIISSIRCSTSQHQNLVKLRFMLKDESIIIHRQASFLLKCILNALSNAKLPPLFQSYLEFYHCEWNNDTYDFHSLYFLLYSLFFYFSFVFFLLKFRLFSLVKRDINL